MNMRFTWVCFLLSAYPVLHAFGQHLPVSEDIVEKTGCPVIPLPADYQKREGSFLLDRLTVVHSPADFPDSLTNSLTSTLREVTGLPFPRGDDRHAHCIRFALDSLAIVQPEGYRMVIDSMQITIAGHDPAGIFYGMQSLAQLALGSRKTGFRAGACVITDFPRYHYKGMHLDVSRHLFPVSAIEKWINALAVFKINTFRLHKGIGAAATLLRLPAGRYNPEAAALVNGLSGSERYNDGQWLGFSGDDLEAVIDLGRIWSIHALGAGILNYHWQKMWAPISLNFSISADGVHYTEVFRQEQFPVNGINRVRHRFPEA